MKDQAAAKSKKNVDFSDIKELILFKVNDLLCGINNHQVQEINRQLNLTIVPHAPEYVRGVINLRGEIVTVVDLRAIFGFKQIDIHNKMHIIVVNFKNDNVGILVDSVMDVIPTEVNNFDSTPANLSQININYFSGVYKLEKELIAIINTEKILDI